MNIQVVKITDIKSNPNNPRVIKDEKFHKLCESIKAFPKMLELRPIVVNDDMVVLGGNMRLKALKHLGLKEAPIIKASDLTEDQQRQFIIKDNAGFPVTIFEGKDRSQYRALQIQEHQYPTPQVQQCPTRLLSYPNPTLRNQRCP